MKISYIPSADLKNWLRIKEKYPENFTITQYYPFDRAIELLQENFDKIISTIKPADLEKFNEQAEKIKLAWEKIETNILNKIFEFLANNLPIIDFKAELTTAYYMPYDEKDYWFMLPTHKTLNEQLKCIAHELFHLYQIKLNPNLSFKEREAAVENFLITINLFIRQT